MVNAGNMLHAYLQCLYHLWVYVEWLDSQFDITWNHIGRVSQGKLYTPCWPRANLGRIVLSKLIMKSQPTLCGTIPQVVRNPAECSRQASIPAFSFFSS